ncbi:lysylphosphatidylglycerol synthase domain-containing protein [Cellulomonas sp. P4]
MSAAVPAGGGAVPPAGEPQRRRPWLRVAVTLAAAALLYRLVTRLVGTVDWAAVGAALGSLEAWVVLPLAGALLLRQVLNAVPLTRFLPGLGIARSTQNDLTANLVATVAPPPADIAVRVAMFRSWGLDPVLGMAGVTLNSVQFYVVRFAVPVLGLGLLAGHGLERRHWLVGGLCALAAAVVLAGLALLLRDERLAAWVGATAGRAVRVVRRGTDPGAWSARTVRLRAETSTGLRTGLVPSLAALTGMVLADAAILLLALRAVGVRGDDLPLTLVLGVFLLCYPLTILPLFGFGVLDALLLGWFTASGGQQVEAGVLAATVVWRVVTLLGTLALGAVALGLWRAGDRRGARAPGPAGR